MPHAPRTPAEFYATTWAFLEAARTRDPRALAEVAAIASGGAGPAGAALMGLGASPRRPLDARLRQPADITPIRAIEQGAPGVPGAPPPPMPPVGPLDPPAPGGNPAPPIVPHEELIGPYEGRPFGPVRFSDPPYPPPPPPFGVVPRVRGADDVRAGSGAAIPTTPGGPGAGLAFDYGLTSLGGGDDLPYEGAPPPADVWVDNFANGLVEYCYQGYGSILDTYAAGVNPDRSRVASAPAGRFPRAVLLKEAGGVDVRVDVVLWSGVPFALCRAEMTPGGINGYGAVDDGTGTVLELYRFDSGAPTLLDAGLAGINQGDTISVRAVGPLIEALWNGAVVASSLDATYPTQTLAGWGSSAVGDSITRLAHNPAP